jgi:hypothetical protein
MFGKELVKGQSRNMFVMPLYQSMGISMLIMVFRMVELPATDELGKSWERPGELLRSCRHVNIAAFVQTRTARPKFLALSLSLSFSLSLTSYTQTRLRFPQTAPP